MTSTKPKIIIEKLSSKDLFVKKIQICSMTYDYYDDQKDIKAKSERLEAIQDLKELLNDSQIMSLHFLPNLELIYEMIQKNLFRPLIPIKKSGEKLGLSETGVEDEEVTTDPAWPHLQGIYEIFLNIEIHELVDVKNLKIFITPVFVNNLLELFNSEDARERDYLKTILYRIYAKLIPRRKIIRKSMNESFLSMIHENKKFNGANDILEIFSSMISGFAVPLREEHVEFFKNIIIPLHKVHYSNTFHEQLVRCSVLYLNKDQSLAILLIKGILRYWPFGNSTKETLFLSELNEILEFCDLNSIEVLIPSIFKRIVKCMSGPHLQISDKAMLFFENEHFLNLIKTFRSITFPLLVPIIVDLSETHWHKILQESFNSLKSILKEIDSALFEKVATSKENKPSNFLVTMHNTPDRAESEQKWANLAEIAKKLEPGFRMPTIPYTDTHVVGLHNLNGIKLHSNNLIPPA